MIEFTFQLLESVGFTHPLHPAATHVPMGMIIGGFLFGLGSIFLGKSDWAKTAHYCFTLALIFVPPTVILGFMDWSYRLSAEWSNIILGKIILAVVLSGLLVAAYLVGKKDPTDAKRTIVIYAFCLITSIGLGFLGGELQYG